jgi:hypothetical protein
LKPEKKFIPIRLAYFPRAFWEQWAKLAQMERDAYVLNAVDLKTSPAFYAFQSTIYWEDFWLLWAVRLWGVLTYST